MEWLNAQAEASGKESVDVSPFEFRYGSPDSSIALKLESLPISSVYLRIALIQVRDLNLKPLTNVRPTLAIQARVLSA